MKRLVLVLWIVACAAVYGTAQESSGAADPTEASADEQFAGESTPIDESTLILGAPEDAADSSVSVSPFSFWDLARMVVVLGAVVAVIYGIFYFLKKAGNGKYANAEQIRLLGSRMLPGNRSVYLVQVGAQVFMLGGGGDAVTMLSEITDKETVDTLILEGTDAGESERKSFSEMIAGLVQTSQGGSLELMRRQRERLQRMR